MVEKFETENIRSRSVYSNDTVSLGLLTFQSFLCELHKRLLP